jgi:hypothetical protein
LFVKNVEKNPKNWNAPSSSSSLCGDLQKALCSRDRTERRRERERENDRGKDDDDDDDDDKKQRDFFAFVDFEGLRDEQRSISESSCRHEVSESTPTRIVVFFVVVVGKNVSRGGGSREGGGGGGGSRRR